jgi:hypothetical protein
MTMHKDAVPQCKNEFAVRSMADGSGPDILTTLSGSTVPVSKSFGTTYFPMKTVRYCMVF